MQNADAIARESVVDVWPINAADFLDQIAYLPVVESDIERANRFKPLLLRDQWLIFRGALRCILSRYVDNTAHKIVFEADRYGKPFIPGSAIHFNVTHSANYALIAIGKCPVGIDCEVQKPHIDIETISQNYFSQQEHDQLMRISEAERLAAFYRCWTRKEAFIKGIGKGLSFPLSNFRVSVNESSPPRLLHVEDDTIDKTQWSLEDLSTTHFYACVAINSPSPHIDKKKFFQPSDLFALAHNR